MEGEGRRDGGWGLRSEMEGEGLRDGGWCAMGDRAGNFLSMLFMQRLKSHF